jgi:hypothetical protein
VSEALEDTALSAIQFILKLREIGIYPILKAIPNSKLSILGTSVLPSPEVIYGFFLLLAVSYTFINV